jgi:hypothetical protein
MVAMNMGMGGPPPGMLLPPQMRPPPQPGMIGMGMDGMGG